MEHDAGFMQEIVARPDEDEPRLVYADYLEEQSDPRSDYIRVQCETAAMVTSTKETDQSRYYTLCKIQQDLWDKYHPLWREPYGLKADTAAGWDMRSHIRLGRGFPSLLSVGAHYLRDNREILPTDISTALGLPTMTATEFMGYQTKTVLRSISSFLARTTKVQIIDPEEQRQLWSQLRMPKVATIKFRDAHIDQQYLQPFRKKMIHTLIINDCDLSDDRVETIIQSPQLQSLRTIALEQLDVGPMNIEDFARGLAQLSHIVVKNSTLRTNEQEDIQQRVSAIRDSIKVTILEKVAVGDAW